MDLLLHLFYQGYLCGQSPAAALSSLEDNGEALVHMQERPHECPLTLLLHRQAPEWLPPVPWAVTELPPSWGALGLEQNSSVFEVSLHPSPDGSAQSEPGAGWAGSWDCYFKAQPNQ